MSLMSLWAKTLKLYINENLSIFQYCQTPAGYLDITVCVKLQEY